MGRAAARARAPTSWNGDRKPFSEAHSSRLIGASWAIGSEAELAESRVRFDGHPELRRVGHPEFEGELHGVHVFQVEAADRADGLGEVADVPIPRIAHLEERAGARVERPEEPLLVPLDQLRHLRGSRVEAFDLLPGVAAERIAFADPRP